MSRVGKLPIAIPAGVTVTVNHGLVQANGPKGEVSQEINTDITIDIADGILTVNRPSDSKMHRALHGLYRALINNMIIGVSQGHSVRQELVGVGYKVSNEGNLVEFVLGYSHKIMLEVPKEIKVTTETLKGQPPAIMMECADKQLLGQVAAKIRSFRKPEPYKGKGIRFAGEVLRRKAGKSASKK